MSLCPPIKIYRILRAAIRLRKEPSSSELLKLNEPESYDFLLYWFYRVVLAAMVFACVKRPSLYGTLFISTILASSVSEDLSLTISPDGVLKTLRSSAGNVLAKLATLILLDVSALAFCIATLQKTTVSLAAHPRGLLLIARQLVTAPKVLSTVFANHQGNLFESLRTTPASDLMVLAFGLPLYGALLRSLVANGFSGLKRTDEDYIHLAHAYGCEARLDKALGALAKVKHHNAHSDHVRYMAYLKSAKIEEAVHWRFRAYETDRDAMHAPDKDDVFTEFFFSWVVLPTPSRKALCAYANDERGFSQGARFLANSLVRNVSRGEGGEAQLVVRNRYNELLGRFSGRSRSEYAPELGHAMEEIASFPAEGSADAFISRTLTCLILLDKNENLDIDEMDTWLTDHKPQIAESVEDLLERYWGQLLIIILADLMKSSIKDRHSGLLAFYIELRASAVTRLKHSRMWKYMSNADI